MEPKLGIFVDELANQGLIEGQAQLPSSTRRFVTSAGSFAWFQAKEVAYAAEVLTMGGHPLPRANCRTTNLVARSHTDRRHLCSVLT